MSNLRDEITKLSQDIVMELTNKENGRNLDNLEAYRSKLENLKMQNSMQLTNSETSLKKYLNDFEDGDFKTSILKHLEGASVDKEKELSELKELNDKFIEEYEAGLQDFIKQLEA